jgi:DNA-binding response OmpR family regulator
VNGPHFNAEGRDGNASRLRLLIVDANADTADSLAILVLAWGYDVRIAFTGPSALVLARMYQPDVVVTGLWLPGLDGYQLARQLRAEVAGAMLIALTGQAQPEDYVRTKEAGFVHHFLKPADPDEVRQLLTAVASRRRPITPSS